MSLVSGLVNAFVQSSATDKAVKASTAAAGESNAEARRQFDLQRGDLAPYRELGTATLPTLKGAYGLGTDAENADAMRRFKESTPDYGFGFDEGKRAVEGQLAAGGVGRFGGGALKALDRYGQNYATQRFGDWRQGLNNPAGIGGGAVQQGNQASQNYSNAYGANTMAAGDARASGYIRNGAIWGPMASDMENRAGEYAGYALGRYAGAGGFGGKFGAS